MIMKSGLPETDKPETASPGWSGERALGLV